jgi:hypothetical protein
LAEAIAAVGAAGAGGGCFCALTAGWAGRCPFGGAPDVGSGFMILTAGVEAALGNSALVGFPVGSEGGPSAAVGLKAGSAFHIGP